MTAEQGTRQRGHTPRVFRIPPELWEAIDAAAKRRNTSRAHVLYNVLRSAIRRGEL